MKAVMIRPRDACACGIALLLLLLACGCGIRGVALPNNCTLERCSGQVHIIVKWHGEKTDILVAGSVQAYAVVGDLVLGRVPAPGHLRTIDEPVGYFILNTKDGHKEMGLTYEKMQETARDKYGVQSIPTMKEVFTPK